MFNFISSIERKSAFLYTSESIVWDLLSLKKQYNAHPDVFLSVGNQLFKIHFSTISGLFNFYIRLNRYMTLNKYFDKRKKALFYPNMCFFLQKMYLCRTPSLLLRYVSLLVRAIRHFVDLFRLQANQIAF